MDKLKAKSAGLKRRKRRVRGKVFGEPTCPRLCVTRTTKHIYAQIIDDRAGHTLVAASSTEPEFKNSGKNGSNIDGAELVGELIGNKAKDKGIESVVFDRGGRIYHGRVKSLAEGARSTGLKF